MTRDVKYLGNHTTVSLEDDIVDMESLPVSLIDLLTNSVILRQTAPYIPVRGLLALAATCKTLRDIVNGQSEAWRHVSLTTISSAKIDSSPIDVGGISWRAERMDESLTEDDFYSGPLRGIFGRLHQKHVLQYVQTLILDGLSVPADLVREIVAEDRYNVKILSIREANNLNQTKLQQVLRYIVRPTRAEGTPKLKALYVYGNIDFFGDKDAARFSVGQQQRLEGSQGLGVMASEGAQIGAEWNYKSSSALTTSLADEEMKWVLPSSSELLSCRISATQIATTLSLFYAAKTVFVAAGASAVIAGGAKTAIRNQSPDFTYGPRFSRRKCEKNCDRVVGMDSQRTAGSEQEGHQ
ncbi:hypothetical protein LTR85_011879 [Meristemomyces frigidus]|nr:hypothetical protein LTR85_011879 [Meristemomyces frigidus]